MEDNDLKEWLKTYLLDILCGMVFWGALFLCYLQGCYYHANGMAGKKILTICMGVLCLAAGVFVMARLFWRKKK